jgi:hypothetical protein
LTVIPWINTVVLLSLLSFSVKMTALLWARLAAGAGTRAAGAGMRALDDGGAVAPQPSPARKARRPVEEVRPRVAVSFSIERALNSGGV